MMRVNSNQLIQMIKSGQNPQQLLMSILEQQAPTSPVFANLHQLVKQGNTQEIEKFARNLAAAQGLDFDRELAIFRQRNGL